MNRIVDIFDKLDEWRHLPAYQLERRADIFFSVYLPDIVKQQFNVGTKCIIPEFPLRIGEIHENKSINKSFKIDYLVVTDQEDYFVLVELKTDKNSGVVNRTGTLKKQENSEYERWLMEL